MTDINNHIYDELAETWRKPTIPTVRLLFELGLWLNAKGFEKSILATTARSQVPVFCCGLPDATRRGVSASSGTTGSRPTSWTTP